MKRLIFVCVILMIGILPGVVLAGWDANLKIFIPTQGQVVFYDNPGCRGEPYMVLKVGEYKDFGTIGFMGSGNWHDKTSCIDVGPGTSMTVYEHGNYGGSSKVFSSGYKSLCGDWWDNKISSCKIRPY